MTGWTPCGTCGGTGKVAVDPPDPVTGKRPRGVQGYGMCPTCNRTHYLRLLTISGEIPDA